MPRQLLVNVNLQQFFRLEPTSHIVLVPTLTPPLEPISPIMREADRKEDIPSCHARGRALPCEGIIESVDECPRALEIRHLRVDEAAFESDIRHGENEDAALVDHVCMRRLGVGNKEGRYLLGHAIEEKGA